MTDAASRDVSRVAVRELVSGQAGPAPVFVDVRRGERVDIGREGRLTVGIEAPDDAISRNALSVTAEADGWRLRLTNRNGATLHPWAQAPEWLSFDAQRTIRWPRVGIRLVGKDDSAQHWVLLEADAFVVAPDGSADLGSADLSDTFVAPRPRGLTMNQLTAVYATFPAHLAWPPVVAPVARSLESVAHRLGVTPSAVRERLRPVQDRARELGLPGQFGVTEPEYVYHLAAHGFFTDVPPPFDGASA